jgi:hypothetical protein
MNRRFAIVITASLSSALTQDLAFSRSRASSKKLSSQSNNCDTSSSFLDNSSEHIVLCDELVGLLRDSLQLEAASIYHRSIENKNIHSEAFRLVWKWPRDEDTGSLTDVDGPRPAITFDQGTRRLSVPLVFDSSVVGLMVIKLTADMADVAFRSSSASKLITRVSKGLAASVALETNRRSAHHRSKAGEPSATIT